MVKILTDKMKIKSLGYRVIDEENGITIELIPKNEDATHELINKFFESFQVLRVESQKAQDRVGKKLSRKSKPEKQKPKRDIPYPAQRRIRELTELMEEFTISDIGDLFEKEGYNRKKIVDNAYHDIIDLLKKNKIISIESTKPKKYRIISRDTGDLV